MMKILINFNQKDIALVERSTTGDAHRKLSEITSAPILNVKNIMDQKDLLTFTSKLSMMEETRQIEKRLL